MSNKRKWKAAMYGIASVVDFIVALTIYGERYVSLIFGFFGFLLLYCFMDAIIEGD